MRTFSLKIFSCLFGVLIFLIGCQSVPEKGTQASLAEAAEKIDELQRQIEMGNIFEGTAVAKIPTIGIIQPSNPSAGQLSQSEIWYLDMIRSAMNSNFTRFASGRIQVVNLSQDVVRALEEERKKSLDSSFSDAHILSITAMIPARAIMTSEIIKQSANRFFLSFTVTETETGIQLAAYNQTHSDIELMEGAAVNRAAESLLRQLNVTLNEAGKHALLGASNESDIALARGLDAADAGQGLQAMNYLFNAATFSNTASQANITLATVQTQNQAELTGAGARVMDFFKRHELWQGRLDEYNNFYLSNAPFDLFYTPPMPSNMRVSGDERTYDLNFFIGLRWNQNQILAMERVYKEYIQDGLYANSAQEIQDWNLRGLPENSRLFSGPDNFVYNLAVNIENENGIVITSGSIRLYGSLFLHQERIYASCTQENNMSFSRIIYIEDQITPHLYIRIVSVNGVDIHAVGQTGFTRVVQTQDNRLPAVQPDSLPRELSLRLQRELAASRIREEEAAQAAAREADRIAQAAAREARKETREKELRNHSLKTSRMYIGAYGGPALVPDSDLLAGTYNIDMGLGTTFFDLEAGFLGYLGTGTVIHGINLAENPYVFGLRMGIGYTYVGRTALFKIIPGMTILIAEKGEHSSEESKNSFFMGNIQVVLDWNPFNPGRGGLFFRLGYRLDIYPKDDELHYVFGRNNSGTFVTNSFLAGLVYYF